MHAAVSRTRPEMGSARRKYIFRNQHNDAVMTMQATGLFATRPAQRTPHGTPPAHAPLDAP